MFDPTSTHEVFADLRKVAHGLSLIFSSYVIRIMTAVFGVILLVAFEDQKALAIAVVLFGGGAFLIGKFMGVRGRSFCLAVPEGSKAKSYIWGLVILDLLEIAWIIGATILEYPKSLSVLVLGVSEFLSLLCFVVFLRHTAALIQNEDLTSRVNGLIVNAGFICGSCVLYSIILTYVPVQPRNGLAFLCSGTTLVGMALVVLIQYANLIRSVGRGVEAMVDAATNYIERTEEFPNSHSDAFE